MGICCCAPFWQEAFTFKTSASGTSRLSPNDHINNRHAFHTRFDTDTHLDAQSSAMKVYSPPHSTPLTPYSSTPSSNSPTTKPVSVREMLGAHTTVPGQISSPSVPTTPIAIPTPNASPNVVGKENCRGLMNENGTLSPIALGLVWNADCEERRATLEPELNPKFDLFSNYGSFSPIRGTRATKDVRPMRLSSSA